MLAEGAVDAEVDAEIEDEERPEPPVDGDDIN
jgi:hypothetical protein